MPRPGQAGLKAVADTAVVSGGPEALLPLAADPAMRDRASVLTGDNHPGLGAPGLQVTGDGLRRADTRFGLVGANTSYTYTRNERNHSGSYQDAGEEPHQILPSDGLRHQTVAELRGARTVTASSSGNWLYYLPQYDPVNAFDGNPDTAWAEGAVGSADGQWLRIGFTDETEVPASIRVTPLPQESVRSAPTRVRVETERGSETSTLRADGSRQAVKAPEGPTSWLRITVVESTARHSGLSGAGFSEITVPDVQVTRMLRLPRDAENAEAAAETVSLHRTSDPGSFSPTGTEVGLHRRWNSDAAGTYEVKASAIPVPGDALDTLLYDVAPEQNDRITAAAGSTARLGTGLSPRNLTDGDLTTAWIAGDDPTIRLSWTGKQPVDEVVLAPAAWAVHPAHRGQHQLPGRRGRRRGRRERRRPLRPDHHGPARHHRHRDGPADRPQPPRRRGHAASGRPDRGVHPRPGRPLPHPEDPLLPRLRTALREGPDARRGRRAVRDERQGNGR